MSFTLNMNISDGKLEFMILITWFTVGILAEKINNYVENFGKALVKIDF